MSTPSEDHTVHAPDCAVHNAPAYPAGECDCQPAPPTVDVESTLEMYKNACARLELQNKRMRYLLERTYYIHEDGSLRQRLMDNLLADVVRDVLERNT